MEEPPLQKKTKLNELDAFFQEIKRLEWKLYICQSI